jgi:hypothetical protein
MRRVVRMKRGARRGVRHESYYVRDKRMCEESEDGVMMAVKDGE